MELNSITIYKRPNLYKTHRVPNILTIPIYTRDGDTTNLTKNLIYQLKSIDADIRINKEHHITKFNLFDFYGIAIRVENQYLNITTRKRLNTYIYFNQTALSLNNNTQENINISDVYTLIKTTQQLDTILKAYLIKYYKDIKFTIYEDDFGYNIKIYTDNWSYNVWE